MKTVVIVAVLNLVTVLGHAQDTTNLNTKIKAVPAKFFDSIFTRNGSGWTGGDVAYSHALPNGRSLWLFGDSFLDTVYANRSRPPSPFYHSVMALTDSSGNFTTIHGGTTKIPEPFFKADEPIQYWPNCAFISSNKKYVYVMLVVIKLTGEGGLFGFKNIGNKVGVLTLPDLKLKEIIPLTDNNKIDWSSGTYEEGNYVYIYGAESLQTTPHTKYMHVCRTSRIDPFKKVEYYTGNNWTFDSSKSERLLSGISEQYTFFKHKNRYYLLSQNGIKPDIFIYDAASPAGPFINKRKVYTTPQTSGKIITYCATVHTEFTKNDSLLVGYCVNSRDINDLYKNADNYRPYFIWVTNWQ